MRHGLIQKIDGSQQNGTVGSAKASAQDQIYSTTVEIECGDIVRRSLLNGALFTRRKPGLQLIRDGLGDFTLDGKDVIDWSIIIFCPLVCVSACIDQLRIHSDLVAGALHAAFEQMGHSELLPYLAKIAGNAALVLHH